MNRKMDVKKWVFGMWLLVLAGSAYLAEYLSNHGYSCFALRLILVDVGSVLPLLLYISWHDWRYGFAEKRTREKKAFGFEISTVESERLIKFRAVLSAGFGLVLLWFIIRFHIWQLWACS